MKHTLRWVAGRNTSAKVYITRIFNFGTWEEWRAMKRRYPRSIIKQAILDPLPGQWSPRAKALAEILYGIRLPNRALISYDA